jgi:bacterioferritin-associated ferredoxin
MFACICNAIREKDLKALAEVEAGDAEALYARLGHAPQCRQCLEDADDLVIEARMAACTRPCAGARLFSPA